MLFSQGSRFGGHALYVKDGKLRYVYNWVGELVQTVESDEPSPDRPRRPLRARSRGRATAMPTDGTLTLHIRDEQVGEGTIMTQPGKFGLGGGGLVVGARAPSRSPTTIPASGPGRSSAARSRRS